MWSEGERGVWSVWDGTKQEVIDGAVVCVMACRVVSIGRKGQEKCVKMEPICTVPSLCLCSEAGLCTYSVGHLVMQATSQWDNL